MGLETGTYIDSLNASNPVGASDPKSQGDDHLRLIKSTIKATFPNLTGAVTFTQAQLNEAARLSAANAFTAANTFDGNVSVLGGNSFIVQDSTNADTLTISESGSNAQIASNTNPIQISSGADSIQFTGGATVRIYDSGNTDYLEFAHDGTDANIDFNATTDLNINDGVNVRMTAGGSLVLHDSGGADSFAIRHDGTDVNLTAVGAADINLIGLTNAFWIRDGAGLQISDSSDADVVALSHDGTDANLEFTGTTDFNIRDGVVAKFFDSSDADYFSIQHDGTDVQIDANTGDLDFNSLSVKSDNDTADEIGYKGIPQRDISASGSLVLTDASKRIYMTGGSGQTLTIPANAGVAFPIGTAIEILNDSGNDWTIAITTDTLEKFGGATGSQTLGDNQKAVIEKVTATLWKYGATD